MAKKKKRRIQAPSLSVLDKTLYYCLITASVLIGLFMYPATIGHFRQSVFEDIHILAQNTIGIVPLGFFGMFIGVPIFATLYALFVEYANKLLIARGKSRSLVNYYPQGYGKIKRRQRSKPKAK